MGRSHLVVEKGGVFWEGGVDSGRVAHIHLLNGGYILGGRVIFWEGRTYNLVEKGGIFREGG